MQQQLSTHRARGQRGPLAQLPGKVLVRNDWAGKVERRIQHVRQVQRRTVVGLAGQGCLLAPARRQRVLARGAASLGVFCGLRGGLRLPRGRPLCCCCCRCCCRCPCNRAMLLSPPPVEVKGKAQHAQQGQVEADLPPHHAPAQVGDHKAPELILLQLDLHCQALQCSAASQRELPGSAALPPQATNINIHGRPPVAVQGGQHRAKRGKAEAVAQARRQQQPDVERPDDSSSARGAK
jgi:hypothetical protein